MNLQKVVAFIVLLIVVIGNEGQTKPSWKIPLEGGYRYIITVEYGGTFYKGGIDEYHTDVRNGYYALDFSITSDIANPKVVAPESGTVVQVFDNPSVDLGYGVKIDHGNGYVSETGHYVSMPYVKVGDYVVQGQLLGVMGSTGNSTGKHTHFQVFYNGLCRSDVPESKPEPLSEYTGDTLKVGKTVMSDNYFVIGKYSNGTTNQAIINRYTQSTLAGHPLGSPVSNRNGGVYVHDWNGVTLQDFRGDSTGYYHGYTAIMLNPNGTQAHVLKEGFWSQYMGNNGAVAYGAARSDEVANWKDTTGAYGQAGKTYQSAQEFERVVMLWDGQQVLVKPRKPDFTIAGGVDITPTPQATPTPTPVGSSGGNHPDPAKPGYLMNYTYTGNGYPVELQSSGNVPSAIVLKGVAQRSTTDNPLVQIELAPVAQFGIYEITQEQFATFNSAYSCIVVGFVKTPKVNK